MADSKGFLPMCISVLIVFGIILFFTGTFVMKPYRFERDHYLDTHCKVVRHVSDGFSDCEYGCGAPRGCRRPSKFPCVVITVEVRDMFNRTKESTLFLEFVPSESPRCSIYDCRESVSKSTEKVSKRLQQWPIGRQAPCVYGTHNNKTLDRRQYSTFQAFNALLWPLWGIFFIGLVMICSCI